MFTYKPVRRVRPAALVSAIITRNKGAPPAAVTDPVQQLFIDKIREYRSKIKGDMFVEPSPEIIKEFEKEIEKLERAYGGAKGMDMTAFPDFSFPDPKLDSIDEEPIGKEDKSGTKKK